MEREAIGDHHRFSITSNAPNRRKPRVLPCHSSALLCSSLRQSEAYANLRVINEIFIAMESARLLTEALFSAAVQS